ncbi:dihydrodipicolinate reductase [Lutimaribacter sp. EGI FJ00015]|uniref:Dihydrodipicolinate reductase n=1 Tax=Lutimaribacter degradans TaxID=2945989 RepID=A0ACC5ZU33_9RHOB|nr:dihydrodipicolinate reductase [Lutimaribacter sp. EGI FJ00013]MCM2561847.1 dihydrodipicolinate reductase [Lutimaribacter sp. EGI FJ00013]MCO0613121.1 dihydrodipicolinate reductase [Lutimaribacter sp. EGI FJ00015]MCO0635679.1 dihydrodipicolinate reductase [Lutimaribacter sp. EGI FJ00014]
MTRLFALCLALIIAAPAWAEEFQTVRDRGTFLSLVKDRDLRISFWGIRLQVTPDGKIEGKALGRPVSGQWQWQGGYFCRDLYWGERDLGPNCQQVQVQGRTIRFTSDKGDGQFADLTLN